MSTSLVDRPADDGEGPVRRQFRTDVRVVSAERSVSERLREIWRYRELLLSLVRKELKVKYKDSFLGFAWSMLNPAFTLTIYYVVFQLILGVGIPLFPIYLGSGLLVWNLFSGALSGATGSIVGNSSIVKKVSFPREILPLASVGAALFNFFLQSIVMALALMLFQHAPSPKHLVLIPFAIVVILLFSSALGIFLSAINVRFRDTQHLLELVLQAWFWATPIIYQVSLATTHLDKIHLTWAYYVFNPITSVVVTFQRALYNKLGPVASGGSEVIPDATALWYLAHLGAVALMSLVLLYGAMRVFGRLEGNFAEEL